MGVNLYFSFVLIIATLIMLIILYFLLNKLKTSIARICSLAIIASSFYSFGYAFEIMATNIEQIKFWLKFEYIGIPFICTIWLIFVVMYTGYEAYLNKSICIILFIIPVLTFIFHYTNDIHHLFYKDISINYNPYFITAKLAKGPAYWVHIIYSYLNLVVGIALYFRMFVRSTLLIKKQIILMILGAVAPWVLNIVYLLEYFSSSIDLEPFGFAITGLVYALGIFKFNLLKLTPIALEKVFHSMKDGVVILDNENNVVNFNNSAKIIIEELNYLNSGQNKIEDILKNYPELLNALKYDENNDSEQCIRRLEDEKYYKLSISIIYDKGNSKLGKILVLSDITEQRELMIRLNKLASIDELTGIYNRRHFSEICSIEIDIAKANNKPVSVIILDIDYFKKVNDTHGHHIGDLVLKNVARILKDNIDKNHIIARYGGEEFAIFLPKTKSDNAVEVAEKLRKAIYDSHYIDQNININVTASFGVYGVNSITHENLSDLIIKADRALYRSKLEGRNKVVLYCEE
ncbi:histidine kinase N-terminal 7TM domain-containing protein [Clostridium sp. DJ247]|uniref:histidine kinase N-terminal 7TM domain-containing diguanylate cyclase n=1 Tax=Clostridium sp. DJ247 TaxID=2726188 RepID=UPI001623522E|nr:histidine kinase N-terminal 7TM domain-containing protein [Clostridium sp. DJ247]MBC2582314.1 diguanylate cyclase [Clostridium sp. DJ247]